MKAYLYSLVEFPKIKEIFYILGLMLLLSMAYAFGCREQWVYGYYTAITVALMIFRVFHYFVIGEECYLYDWCYYATVLDLVYVNLFPQNRTMHLVFLGFSNGLQLWSVLLMKNALVIHRPDKITSLFLHNIHSFIAYLVRTDTTSRFIKLEMNDSIYSDYLYYTSKAYMIWFVIYLLAQNVVFASYIKKNKLSSLVDYVKSLNKTVGNIIDSVNGGWKNLVFLTGHLVMYIVFTLLSLLSLYSIKFHLVMCCISMLSVIKEGATYYTKVMKDSTLTPKEVQDKKDK